MLLAWLVIRLAAAFVPYAALARLIAVFAWVVAALDIVHLVGPTLDLLDSLAVEIGGLGVSILTVVKGVLSIAMLLWAATVASNLFERRITRTSAGRSPDRRRPVRCRPRHGHAVPHRRPLPHAHDLAFGTSRSMQLPGFSVAVGDMVASVRRAGGEQAYTRIRWKPDPLMQRIVSGWPQALAAPRAVALGFTADNGIDEVVQAFTEDDLDMQKRLA